jgi:hypothetical protein
MSVPDRVRLVAVGPVSATSEAGTHRIAAEADGALLWFESPDLRLRPAPEAFGSAFLIPALQHRARLRLSDPLDPTWVANASELAAILHGWWRLPPWPPVSEAPSRPVAPGVPTPPDDGPTALFFSGGVDSFHRLLRNQRPVDMLVTLLGFDIALDDRARAEIVVTAAHTIAAAVGARSVVVRTNARQHPLIRDTKWERAHGGVLAAVGHMLAPAARRVLIATSPPGDKEVPWGSHWRIDPLWSSREVAIVHDGRGLRRIDKLREIAAEPLVREHLHVCWRHYEATGNCARCAKCLLAMLILEECGELQHSRVFGGREDLVRGLNALRQSLDRLHTFEELARSPRLDPVVAAAAWGLVRRSRHSLRPDVRLRRSVIRWAATRFGGPRP